MLLDDKEKFQTFKGCMFEEKNTKFFADNITELCFVIDRKIRQMKP